MKKVTIEEAENDLVNLIDVVERGEDVHLTKNGESVAVLIAEERYQELLDGNKQIFNAIMRWRAQHQYIEVSDEEIASWRTGSINHQTQNIVELLAMEQDIEFEPPKFLN
ncbi:type II toxin-antitoxin system Phd/YefM family antitoxin [uncultured Thiothrix sp.]|uniref:type II toxin-antitoxin system Phd/YefM family antitoxin n=1 Tax=uncultured Thiothrix sp. TaxID=223185 RepID=UPI00260BC316|nr:type II toxin-antitoxin system Phd/YefM family antitoxin [uncultured Thiothrix sp.]